MITGLTPHCAKFDLYNYKLYRMDNEETFKTEKIYTKKELFAKLFSNNVSAGALLNSDCEYGKMIEFLWVGHLLYTQEDYMAMAMPKPKKSLDS